MQDVKPLLGKNLLYRQAFDLPAKEVLCQLCAVCLAGHQDATGLSPATDIHLRFEDESIAQCTEMRGEFVS
jgi:hypothetical protein